MNCKWFSKNISYNNNRNTFHKYRKYIQIEINFVIIIIEVTKKILLLDCVYIEPME